MPDPLPKIPCDSNAEKIILGAILIESPKQGEIFDALESEDFFSPDNRRIFDTSKKLWDANESVSLLTVNNAIGYADGMLTAYLSGLTDGIPRVDSTIPRMLKRVRETRVLREIMHAAQTIGRSAENCGNDTSMLSAIVDSAIESFVRLGEKSDDGERAISDYVASHQLLSNLKNPDTRHRLATGIPLIDRITGGFVGGELVIYVALTGSGKSLLALQTKRLSCSHGQHGLFASGEMLAAHLMGRSLATVSGVEHWKIRRPEKIDLAEMALLSTYVEKQCKTCCTLDGDLTLPRIRMAARAMAAKKQLRWIIVDYDELVEVAGCKSEWDEQKILARSLKSLGMQLNVPVILISQLRKTLSENQLSRPTIDDLYGSGAKGKHASIVILVVRPFVQKLEGDETEAKAWILKCRDGRQGSVDCIFNVKTLTFEEKTETGTNQVYIPDSLAPDSVQDRDKVYTEQDGLLLSEREPEIEEEADVF